jgi:hypothetical protein
LVLLLLPSSLLASIDSYGGAGKCKQSDNLTELRGDEHKRLRLRASAAPAGQKKK